MCSFDNVQCDDNIDFDNRDVSELLNACTCPGECGTGNNSCPVVAEQARKAMNSIAANIADNLGGRRY